VPAWMCRARMPACYVHAGHPHVARPLIARARMPQEEEEQGLDIHAIADIAKYVLRAPKRRPARFFALLAVALALAGAIFVLYPRTYSTEVKILAQRNLVLPALGNPNRTVPREA